MQEGDKGQVICSKTARSCQLVTNIHPTFWYSMGWELSSKTGPPVLRTLKLHNAVTLTAVNKLDEAVHCARLYSIRDLNGSMVAQLVYAPPGFLFRTTDTTTTRQKATYTLMDTILEGFHDNALTTSDSSVAGKGDDDEFPTATDNCELAHWNFFRKIHDSTYGEENVRTINATR